MEFSVVLPVHNGERYIAQTIESILKQTYPDFRLMILENASTDRTLEVIRSFSDPRITIVPAPALLSIQDNWGRTLTLDLQNYVTFISHDDLIYPEFLESVVTLIEAEPQASVYLTNYHLIDDTGKVLREALPCPYKETVREFMTATHSFRREITSVACAARSEDYRRVGGFPRFPQLLYADLICWYRLTALSYKVCDPRPLAAFRLHSASATRSSVLVTYYEASRQYLEAVSQIEQPPSEETTRLAIRHIAKAFQLKQRQILEDLILNYDSQRYRAYLQDRQALAAVVAENPVFPTADALSRILEREAALPFDVLRRGLLAGTRLGVSLMRRLARRG